MRTQFARILCLMFLAASDAHAQTTAPAPGPVSPPEVDGGVAEWWWVIILLLVAGLAAWYFMRGRT
jgi:hypothetical protein